MSVGTESTQRVFFRDTEFLKFLKTPDSLLMWGDHQDAQVYSDLLGLKIGILFVRNREVTTEEPHSCDPWPNSSFRISQKLTDETIILVNYLSQIIVIPGGSPGEFMN